LFFDVKSTFIENISVTGRHTKRECLPKHNLKSSHFHKPLKMRLLNRIRVLKKWAGVAKNFVSNATV